MAMRVRAGGGEERRAGWIEARGPAPVRLGRTEGHRAGGCARQIEQGEGEATEEGWHGAGNSSMGRVGASGTFAYGWANP